MNNVTYTNTKKINLRTETRIVDDNTSPQTVFVVYENGKELCWFNYLYYAYRTIQREEEHHKFLSRRHTSIDNSCEICNNHESERVMETRTETKR